MSETLSNAPQANGLARELVEPLTSRAVFYFSLAHRHVRRARTRKILRSLSDEQLRDAGIDSSMIHSGPKFEVDARLMSALMSLR
jgi:uncharacterized protein YjiS (DUF1127 family)